MWYNILNRQNGLIWTAEVSFLHKLALMEFALSQVWFLQMEMRIFCASMWRSLTLSHFPLITASLSNGKVGCVNINVRSAERGNLKFFLFCCRGTFIWCACGFFVSFSIFCVSEFFLFFNCIQLIFISPIYASTIFFMHHLSSRFLSVTFCNKASD